MTAKNKAIAKALRKADEEVGADFFGLEDDARKVLEELYDSAAQNEREAIRMWLKTEIGPYGDCKTGCYEMLVGDFDEYFPCVRKESTTNGQ